MNYIGLIFSFMIPGIVIGAMIAGIYYEAKEKRHAKKRKRRCHRPISTWNELYVGEDR